MIKEPSKTQIVPDKRAYRNVDSPPRMGLRTALRKSFLYEPDKKAFCGHRQPVDAMFLKVGPNPGRVVAYEKIDLRRDVQGEKNAPKHPQSYSCHAPSLQGLFPHSINWIPEPRTIVCAKTAEVPWTKARMLPLSKHLRLEDAQVLINGVIGRWEFGQSGSRVTFR